MQLLLSGIINCTQLVGVVTSLWTMDRFGRRPLLLVGAGLMFVCHLIIAVLVGKFGGRWANYATEGWVAVAFLFFYMFSFGATWGPVPWAMPVGLQHLHLKYNRLIFPSPKYSLVRCAPKVLRCPPARTGSTTSSLYV